MTQQKLPAYFKEYLDERFGRVLEEIQDVKEDVASLKKSVSGTNTQINKLWIGLGIVVIVLLVHFGESSGDILRFFGFL